MQATPAGTQRFRDAQPLLHQPHYRQTPDGLTVASIGLSATHGEPTDSVDTHYRSAFTRALSMGANVFDLAVQARHQRTERAFGSWLQIAFENDTLQRDEIVVATKGGYIPFDRFPPADPQQWVIETFVESGLVEAEDFAANFHYCLAPAFLETMIELSCANLGLETIDIYYLQNPETLRLARSDSAFRRAMLDAFETLEIAVEKGRIASYGISTWTGGRAMPDAPDYLSITELVSLATQVAGQDHHLRYLQLPYNLMMTESFAFENQQLGEAFASPIAAAAALGLTVMTSAPLNQGRLAKPLLSQLEQFLPDLETPAQMAIQFARSTPGITTTTVGMRALGHVRDNCELLSIAPVSAETIERMFKWNAADGE